jgi:ribonucleotide reductase beta subunit family protein with ferritin-like domain
MNMKAKASFWTSEEMDLSKGVHDWTNCLGLIFSDEFICHDESMHIDFVCLLFSHIKDYLHLDHVHLLAQEVRSHAWPYILW